MLEWLTDSDCESSAETIIITVFNFNFAKQNKIFVRISLNQIEQYLTQGQFNKLIQNFSFSDYSGSAKS